MGTDKQNRIFSNFLKKLFFVKYLFYNHLSTYCENLDVTCASEVVFIENLITIVIACLFTLIFKNG